MRSMEPVAELGDVMLVFWGDADGAGTNDRLEVGVVCELADGRHPTAIRNFFGELVSCKFTETHHSTVYPADDMDLDGLQRAVRSRGSGRFGADGYDDALDLVEGFRR